MSNNIEKHVTYKELSYIYGCIDVIPYELHDTEYLMTFTHPKCVLFQYDVEKDKFHRLFTIPWKFIRLQSEFKSDWCNHHSYHAHATPDMLKIFDHHIEDNISDNLDSSFMIISKPLDPMITISSNNFNQDNYFEMEQKHHYSEFIKYVKYKQITLFNHKTILTCQLNHQYDQQKFEKLTYPIKLPISFSGVDQLKVISWHHMLVLFCLKKQQIRAPSAHWNVWFIDMIHNKFYPSHKIVSDKYCAYHTFVKTVDEYVHCFGESMHHAFRIVDVVPDNLLNIMVDLCVFGYVREIESKYHFHQPVPFYLIKMILSFFPARL